MAIKLLTILAGALVASQIPGMPVIVPDSLTKRTDDAARRTRDDREAAARVRSSLMPPEEWSLSVYTGRRYDYVSYKMKLDFGRIIIRHKDSGWKITFKSESELDDAIRNINLEDKHAWALVAAKDFFVRDRSAAMMYV